MELKVEKIKDGTVIDRLEAFSGAKVLRMLNLVPPPGIERQERMTLVVNVPSKHIGRKDILKIEGKYLEAHEVDRIALICPRARLNIVRSGQVVEKKDVQLPQKLENVAGCPNPNCISREGGKSRFNVEPEGIRCRYCERRFHANELVL